MRSLREIVFRLRQEAVNLRYFVFPPRVHGLQAKPFKELPDPSLVIEQLRGTAYEREVIKLAEEVLRHRFPLFGEVLQTDEQIDWRRDYKHGLSTPLIYFRRLPYLDFSRCGDHKFIWELNRHQHLVLLAQAWRMTGEQRYLDELQKQLVSWWEANPMQQGINWASALEVAFRALSWLWIWRLAGERLPEQFLLELYRHGLHLEANLSIYFSPNTHLLGEAVALHALGLLFSDRPEGIRWRQLGRTIVLEEMRRQVREDGSHFEQSSYYHVYALDLFLFHHLLEPASEVYQKKLQKMASYLDALLGPQRRLPFLGDDDGGRLFFPYGVRETFGNSTLATCAMLFRDGGWRYLDEDIPVQASWWLKDARQTTPPSSEPARNSRLFDKSGTVVMEHAGVHLVCRTGAMGFGRSGHSHADALSLVLRCGNEDVLIDPGTFTYVADQNLREWFRGTAAHNTVSVDGGSQATPQGPFGWSGQPRVHVLQWESNHNQDWLDARCECGWSHRRRVVFLKAELLVLILDEVQASSGHQALQYWHTPDEQTWERFAFAGGELRKESGWRSPVHGVRIPAPVMCQAGTLPSCLATAIDVSKTPSEARLDLRKNPTGHTLRWTGRTSVAVDFNE